MLSNEEYRKTFIRMMDGLREKAYKGNTTCAGVDCNDCPLGKEVCSPAGSAHGVITVGLVNAVKAVEVVEEWGEKHPAFLQELPDYHFSREEFESAFREIFTVDEIAELEDRCQGHANVYSEFLLYWQDDTFYIMHLASGTIISWYKHLGRANTCNREDFDISDLKAFLKLLKEDIDLLPAKGGAE